ncbi:hypothetical protein [Hymenobacter terricola]|uniref:hypothetical protein n=1 Tax=Hymenobacter terricola TaxID=2819236 RepID=UPI001B30B76F|nr:hypothetical protein [Hymenobacter terricola]
MRISLSVPAATLLATGLLAVAGCSCPPSDPPPPQLTLAFSTDTLAPGGVGFRRAEMRTAYLVRYRAADFQPLLDTLRQPTAATVNSGKPMFSVFYGPGYAPQFGLSEFISQNVYARSFRLVVPAAGRTYDITNVVLEQAAGSGRCAAPHLSRREATINGQLRDGLNNPPELTK